MSSDILQFWYGLPILFINTNINNHQQTYKIMGCFDTGKLSDSGTKNGSVTPVWVGALLVWVRLCRANMMTVADAKRFVASRRARRSGIAAPLWHIWLPAAPLRQLPGQLVRACMQGQPYFEYRNISPELPTLMSRKGAHSLEDVTNRPPLLGEKSHHRCHFPVSDTVTYW